MSDTKEISIVSRWSELVLYRGQHATLREALLAAVASGADLSDADLGDADLRDADLRSANLGSANLAGANLGGADLSDADLRSADLRDADLRSADLRSANLGGANLGGANLHDANLHDADLGGANLHGANLGGANLHGANLHDADLGGANLSGANLHDADLGGANLSDIRNAVPDLAAAKADLWSIFDLTSAEVPAVRAALLAGKVDGSTYTGTCSCLIGTIATARACSEYDIPGVKPDSSRPAEQFFMQIRPGHVPGVNYHAALAVLWIDEWTAVRRQRALSPEAIVVLRKIHEKTSCPDPSDGGCIGGPIPGYGCVHEAIGFVLKGVGA